MAQGSGGYGGPDFAGIENNLRNIAVQFSSILQIQMQLRASVDAWVTLERELVLAQAAAEGTKRQFAEMERSARTFALASTFSAGQVANAFYNLASAGLNVNQTLAASSGVLLLAQATLVDIGQASDTAASAMAQFGLDAAETYRISNLFVASTNASLSTVPKLSFALRQVGPMARDAGLSIEDVVTSLDKLFDVGLRGEQAGTALRNAIARLQDPSGEASLALRAYGVELTNAQGQARQWLDIMRDLARVNPSQASLTQIFGLEAATGASALLQSLRKELDSGSTAWDRHRKEITNTDAAYRQAALQMATFGGQLQVAANHFNEFRIQVGQALAPVITGFLSQVNSAVGGFNEMSQAQKISTISTVLWGVEALVAAKSLGVLISGAGNGAKAITQFQTAMAAYRASVTASLAGPTGFANSPFVNATKSATAFLGVLGSIASTAVALGGLVAVMYAIKQGIDAANDAAEKAAIQQIASGTFERYAQNNRARLQARQINPDNLIDQTNTAAAFNDQASNLRKQFQVQDDGTGAFQLIRAQSTTIDQGRQEIRTLQEKQRALTQDFRQFGEQRQRLGEAISSAYSQSFFGMDVTRGVEENLVQGSDDAGQTARRILAEAGRVTQAGVGGARAALVTYYNARIKDAQTSEGLTSSARQEIIRRSIAIRNNVIAADQAGIETIYGAFSKSANSASEKLAKEGATRSISSLTMSDYTNNIRDFGAAFANGVKENLVMTEEQLNNAVSDIKNQENVTRAAVDRLVRELPALDDLFSKEIIAFILRNANFTPAQKAAFEAAVRTKEGQRSLQEITERARAEHLELGAAAQMFGTSLALFRNDVKVKINAAVDKGLGTPMIDVFQLEKKFNENNLAFQRQALRSAELAQNNPQALAIMKDITKGSNQAAMDTAVDDLVRSFNSSNDAQNREKLDRLLRGPSGEGNRQTIEGIFQRYIQSGAQGKSQAGAQLQAFLTKQGVFDATTQGDVPAALRTAARGLEAQQLGNQNALKEYTNRINTTVTPEETIRKELNALPSRSQLDLQSDQLEQQARATLGEYFNMPLEAITRAMQNTQLQYREKIAEFRDKYRTMFTDTLAKGVDGAQGNAEMQDAFSGRLIEQLVSTGSTKFNGNTYSEVDKLLSAITDQFSAVTANAPEHEARVQKAREILASLARNIGLTVDQLGAEMQVNRLKLMDTRTKIQDFMRNFDAQQLMDDLTRAIRQDALTGQQSVTLQLAVDAQVGQVRLDGAQAVAKMRESFAEYFRNANIPVVFNPQTQQFEAAGDKISTDPAVVAGKLFDNASTRFAQAVAAFANTGGHSGPGDNVSGSLRTPDIGRVTGRFGDARPGHTHAGTDYAVPIGTNIAATGAGVVRAAGQRGAYGNAVEIDHGNGITSLYAHLSRIMVQAGQRITAEQLIGLSGNTGRSTGPHLHYEVRRNGKAVDPRDSYAYHGTRQPASNDDNRDTPDVVVTARTNPEQDRAQRAAEDARIAAFNKMLADEAKYWQEVESFTKRPENAIIALAAAAEQADKKFADFGGRLLDSEKYFVNLDKNFAELREKMFVGMAGQSRNANAFIPEIEGAKRAQQLATIEGERIDALRQVRSLYAQQAIDAQSLADIEAQINGYYENRRTLAGRSVEDRRSTLRERAEILRVQSDSNTVQGSGDMIRGLRAELLQFAAEIPTVFETASQLAAQALQGPGQLMSDLLTTGGKNARSLVAQMASSMASLIATMMTNFAVMQLISVLPGGRALLAAMDAASKVSSVVSAGAAVGNVLATSARSNSNSFVDPINTGIRVDPNIKYADGGVHYAPASRAQLAMGGVRAPFNGSRAIFGEGQHPEAFIPMVDRQTIPVTFDQQGNAYVPLPSGQRIPVTVNNYGAAYNDNHEERYFANGGVAGDNVIPFTPQRARVADQMVSGRETEAVAPMRGSTGGVQQQPSNLTQITDLGGIHVTIQGNANEQDANAIAETIMKRVTEALDVRDAENFRRNAKRQQSVQAGYYGSN